jgi:hypothetical protein
MRWIEERGFGAGATVEPLTQLRPPAPLALLQFSQIRHHPMTRAAGRANRLNQRPVGVLLAALVSFEALQKHRILAAETTLLLCNKNGIELRENKRVGRDYIAPRRLHPAPNSLKANSA